MNKLPFESKKFIALTIAVTFTTIFTTVSLLIIALIPSVSSAIVNLMTVCLAAINGAVSLYSVGQSAVDWKINSNSISSQLNSHETKKIEMKKLEVEYDDVPPIDWDNF